ncbi:MAG: hypothetical protein R2847_06760 [Bacteroidia bacterium]
MEAAAFLQQVLLFLAGALALGLWHQPLSSLQQVLLLLLFSGCFNRFFAAIIRYILPD